MFGDSFTQRATAPLRQTEGVGAGVSPLCGERRNVSVSRGKFFSFFANSFLASVALGF